MILKFWYSYLIGRCFWCKQTTNVIYTFQGCGKYHDTLMCSQCYENKLNSKKKITNSYYPINPDPLGMTIKLYKPILQYIYNPSSYDT